MAQAHTAHDAGKYYIPHGSKWPIVGSVSLFVTMLGAAALLNGVSLAPWLLLRRACSRCSTCSTAGSAP